MGGIEIIAEVSCDNCKAKGTPGESFWITAEGVFCDLCFKKRNIEGEKI